MSRSRRSRRLRVLVGLVAGALVLTGCAGAAPAPPPRPVPAVPVVGTAPAPGSFVTAEGTSLVADGEPFRFVGVNIYDAAASDLYTCKPSTYQTDEELADTLRRLHDEAGVTVLRFWAYQTYTRSGQDFSGVDRVIDAARAAGMRVFPSLEDGPGNCTTTPPYTRKDSLDGDTWYTAGYRQPLGSAALSFRDYARVVAEHYRDEPTILGWSLMNEAETPARTPDGQSVLVDFARDVARVVHEADPNHLVTLGTQSNGAPGASGPDFVAVHGLPEIDFADVHDWGFWGSDTDPMPGGTGGVPPPPDADRCRRLDAKIGCSFAAATALDKPLVVGEAGIPADDPASRQRRADQLGAKMSAAFAAGAAGYLVWHVTTAPTDTYDVILADDDPTLAALAAQVHDHG